MIRYLRSADAFRSFAEPYARAREREGRLCTDEQLRFLPATARDHPLREEWRMRRDSARRLRRHLRACGGGRILLEVGCGNGWLSNFIAGIPGWEVYALDIHEAELLQADRVFGARPNLHFLLGDIFEDPLPFGSADLILLAGVLQYFPDLSALLDRLCGLLAPGGEIHIMDSPLYARTGVAAARERSEKYYARIGVPEMSERYYHHAAELLASRHPRWRYRPRGWLLRAGRLIGRRFSPFPWLSIASPAATGTGER